VSTHENHEEFELGYWGDCCNSFDEEQKSFVYAQYMGLLINRYTFRVQGRNVLDIGGGPVSMLLKADLLGDNCAVVDPLLNKFPEWVRQRYEEKGIKMYATRGEDILEDIPSPQNKFDEVWIYNCLQHTDDPRLIIENASKVAPALRIFEWVDIPPHEGHPWMLTRQLLDEWIGHQGDVTYLARQGCYGTAYFSFFTAGSSGSRT
jgi:SAM-dependent methyltransferase